jgi:hypothetical protein
MQITVYHVPSENIYLPQMNVWPVIQIVKHVSNLPSVPHAQQENSCITDNAYLPAQQS